MAVLRGTIKATCAGVNVDNVLSFKTSAPVGTDLADNFAQALWTAWNPVADVLSTEYVVRSVDMADYDDPSWGGTFASDYAGGRSGSLLPLTVCAKVGWTTGLRGRAYRGRTGLCGLLEEDTGASAPNELTSGARTTIATGVQDFFDNVNSIMTAVSGIATVLAVASTIVDEAPRPAAIGTPVTGWLVYTQLGTRRSRLD